jgi:hypothetical protein
VAQLEQTVGKTQLVHDLHDRRVQRVPAELAVEVGVSLEQRHVDAAPRQQQRQQQKLFAQTRQNRTKQGTSPRSSNYLIEIILPFPMRQARPPCSHACAVLGYQRES